MMWKHRSHHSPLTGILAARVLWMMGATALEAQTMKVIAGTGEAGFEDGVAWKIQQTDSSRSLR